VLDIPLVGLEMLRAIRAIDDSPQPHAAEEVARVMMPAKLA